MEDYTKNLPEKASEYYTEESLFDKIKNFTKKAGRNMIHKTLILYNTLKDPDTPGWAKTVIYGALGYFIWPLDTIPDFTPVAGFTDDLGALAGAIAVVAFHIKDRHKALAEKQLAEFFDKNK
jgi:uncharacterized membrane protein YkvA (DUF1232 family)